VVVIVVEDKKSAKKFRQTTKQSLHIELSPAFSNATGRLTHDITQHCV
jgi:hypothetical protein